MDIEKVGKAIAYLRKRAGYTQKELADRIGISDKAVSKWERGLGLPDTAIIGKVAILLDTDTDSLLAGDMIHHDSEWNGLLLLEENAVGIGAGTIIYDKPLVYFLISYFMLMGIKKVEIVCGINDRLFIEKEFGNGSRLGMSILCLESVEPEKYASRPGNVMVVFGRSIIYGVDQTRFFQKAMLHRDRVTILSLPKKKLGHPSRIYFNADKEIVSPDDEDQLITQYAYHQIPVIFCSNKVIGQTEHNMHTFYESMKDVLNHEKLYTVTLDRGFVEIQVSTPDDVMEAAMFVKSVQSACGMQIYCVEEIAWRRGLITSEGLAECAKEKAGTDYGIYLKSLLGQR
ncbi:MAG: helix-turn-helix domain-containing protein [Roseburia sp.]|nr:helix-turn-helix domain-containing protein [Roseburia sp.]